MKKKKKKRETDVKNVNKLWTIFAFSPAYAGENCEGDEEEFRICEISECQEQVDLRAEQCARLQSLMGFPASSARHNSTWLPYEPEAESLSCQLICRNRKTGEIFNSGENLLDGTFCRYGGSDICVQVNRKSTIINRNDCKGEK